MARVLLTGSTGFVGRRVARTLSSAGFLVTRAVRSTGDKDAIKVGSINAETDWRPALDGCDAVVHLAARTPAAGVDTEEFTAVNDLGTARLVAQARETGVEKFILMSSIFAVTANANEEVVDDFMSTCTTLPYGRSKLAAEAHVAAFASGGRTGISLRPPLVYDATAKGNWYLLQKLAATGLPLPFGRAHNRRSMISLANLTDAVLVALRGACPERSGAYAVADNESLSLSQILTRLREGMGKSPRLVPLPLSLLEAPLKLVGRGAVTQSLFGTLEINSTRFRQTFGWSPPESAQEAILRSGREFSDVH
ncbi:NAD-dependent epimerase/dehydratase [Pseudorhizobium banfieldiae]|uniref:NAD-dependent epimerase/dehydratase n=1 Tax=Pseudorhizobium banfieldiae TaxID=1125847 RepID=L0NIZ7_9HYPH|nr:NAD-dependent epimerase/dehydratase family protein [Pseudorhizobium banfieldiae]CAD6617760.1 NAD-dependent epimerase/dehydratase [arsenite-oxidising bacterium NT-25]CCF20859.1 NAD-dependent epimerase/dehydratase [Pseudorhizobium banfieldiae]